MLPTVPPWARIQGGRRMPGLAWVVRVGLGVAWRRARDQRSAWTHPTTFGSDVSVLVELYAEHDAECSPVLVGLSLADTKVAVTEWVRRAEAVTAIDPSALEAPPAVAPSETRWSRTLDDRAEQRSSRLTRVGPR